jgi:hypothetical protein
LLLAGKDFYQIFCVKPAENRVTFLSAKYYRNITDCGPAVHCLKVVWKDYFFGRQDDQ